MRTRPHSENQPLKIGIMGTPLDSGNRGVQALGAALARLCLGLGSAVEVRLFGSHRTGEPTRMRPEGTARLIPITHWRLSYRSRWRDHLGVILVGSLLYRVLPFRAGQRLIARTIPWIGALEDMDVVGDVRGGDSFSDIYGMKRFLLATLPVLSVLMIKRDIVLFPQTYGPYNSGLARYIARFIIRRSSVVIARDRESRQLAQALARPDQTVALTPDVAFALHSDPMDKIQIDTSPEPLPIPPDTIGLNINGLMYNGGYTGRNMFGLKLDYRRFCRELVIRLLEIHSGPILLVPHTYAAPGDVESDDEACRQLKASLPTSDQARLWVVTGEYDAHQLKGIIRQCEFFAGSRMHSCIAALSQGVPCAGIAYSMKFKGVFDSVGMGDWVIDARSETEDTAILAVIARYRKRQQVGEKLKEESESARNELMAAFSMILPVSTAQPQPAAPASP